MEAILEIAQRYELRIIEDCAQAHGAGLNARKVGTWGDIAAFSFYPTKNLAAFGDGGVVVTNDGYLAERMRLLRQYGWRERYISDVPGVNSRLDELQAAILRVKLRYLDEENECRRGIASQFQKLFCNGHVRLPQERQGAYHVYHQYVIRSSQRDSLRAYLEAQNIKTGIHYPQPIHLQPAYSDRLELRPSLPFTEQIASEILSLPMFPQLAPEQIARITQAIKNWVPMTIF